MASADSAVLVVDIQAKLLPYIEDGDRVLRRAKFLVNVARTLEIPVFATEQNPARLGENDPLLGPFHPASFAKMSFGAGGCEEVMEALAASGRRKVVLVGVETHICVSLSAHDLQAAGYEVVVCPDATGARTMDRHKLGMERIRDAGVVPAHTEAVAYEWMGSAAHPQFSSVLRLVKEAGL